MSRAGGRWLSTSRHRCFASTEVNVAWMARHWFGLSTHLCRRAIAVQLLCVGVPLLRCAIAQESPPFSTLSGCLQDLNTIRLLMQSTSAHTANFLAPCMWCLHGSSTAGLCCPITRNPSPATEPSAEVFGVFVFSAT